MTAATILQYATESVAEAQTVDALTLRILTASAIIAALIALLRNTDSAFSRWMAERRRYAVQSDDVRVADLARDVKYLVAKVQMLESKVQKFEYDVSQRDELISAHEEWDRKIIAEVRRHNPEYEHLNPPSLRTNTTYTEDRTYLDGLIAHDAPTTEPGEGQP